MSSIRNHTIDTFADLQPGLACVSVPVAYRLNQAEPVVSLLGNEDKLGMT
ncbi:MAG: hypothetical protein KZQ93_05305 [Candidatus Thiodiazotropha sp. (ex Monitilora ramsayi)]|nr:hypothetical protein [Candidatus Thiodiazotropha sp. (ex Monitilora ramsayi)]